MIQPDSNRFLLHIAVHDAAHDCFLRCFLPGQFSNKAALVHDIDSITDTKDFWHLRRNNDDRFPLLCQLVDDTVNLILGADIDTTRRFIEDQDVRVCLNPARQHDLLLIAAR